MRQRKYCRYLPASSFLPAPTILETKGVAPANVVFKNSDAVRKVMLPRPTAPTARVLTLPMKRVSTNPNKVKAKLEKTTGAAS